MALTKEWRHRIMAWRLELSKHLYQPIGTINLEAAFTKAQYSLEQALETLKFVPVSPETAWGGKWEYGWFKGELTIPDFAEGQTIALMLDVGRETKVTMELRGDEMVPVLEEDVAEAAVYINGDYAGAMDYQHKVLFFTDAAKVGERFSVVMEAYAGHGPREWRSGPTPPDRETVPEPPEMQCKVGENHFGIWNELAYQLTMDVETLYDLRDNLDEDSLRVMEIDEGLKDFTLIADFEAPPAQMMASFQAARDRLKPLFEKKNGDTTPEMIAFGHAHLDVAWLWPLAETERKCVRTFSSQLALMKRYPEYKFLQSQPHLYQMVKDHYPDLYDKVMEAVSRGQWIPEGAAWVEPDTNITGGESLIRQLIHGKRFYRDEFGVDCQLLWLPDVFGYSGALPQIILGCGVRFFSPQKIFWAYHGGEPFPYNTFIWEGIDGSQVMAHFHYEYSSEVKPSEVINRWKDRVQKDGFSARLFPFGWGDGGGGATREHLESARRLKNLEGVPKFRIDNPVNFFLEQEKVGWPEAKYAGELYFQAHRGTYTSQAKTKMLNRHCEYALRDAEIWGAVSKTMGLFKFPYEAWDAAWKKLLLNQFHDILPGSSIHRVYEEAEEQLGEVLESGETWMEAAQKALIKEKTGISFFNSLSWDRCELAALPEGLEGIRSSGDKELAVQVVGNKHYAEVKVPAFGWQGYLPAAPGPYDNTIRANEQVLENDLVRVNFNEFGEITSIYDKEKEDELTAGLCNSLKMYQDIPSAFDAWDIDSMYRYRPVDMLEKAEISVEASGPLFGSLLIKRNLNNSSMVQRITLRRNSRRMDFQTLVDWQERHKLLKVNFPVDYRAREALHEIQFGHITRPTHRSREIDRDRFEVSNHKWTALAEPDRGFAILNDSKYGVDVLDNSINLTLLKSPLAPDMTADRGQQAFTYAFYFWNGPFFESGLVQQAYQLNIPLRMIEGYAESQSLFRIDQPNVILETVKPAEDSTSGDIILRLYESMGNKTQIRLTSSLPIKRVFQADMLENIKEECTWTEKGLELDFRPFEIKTFRLVMQ